MGPHSATFPTMETWKTHGAIVCTPPYPQTPRLTSSAIPNSPPLNTAPTFHDNPQSAIRKPNHDTIVVVLFIFFTNLIVYHCAYYRFFPTFAEDKS